MGQENILSELEKLKNILNDAKKLPFSKLVSIDRDEFISIINKIELMLPNEVKEAFFIKSKKEEILKEAYLEKEKIISEAKEKQRTYLSESFILQEANKEKEKMLKDARVDADKIRKEAEDYAYGILSKIEDFIDKAKSIVEQGKKELKDENPR